MSWKNANVNVESFSQLVKSLQVMKSALEAERKEAIKTAKVLMKEVEKEVKAKKEKGDV